MSFDRAFGRLIWYGAFVANFLVFSLAAFVIFENHQDVLSKAEKQAETTPGCWNRISAALSGRSTSRCTR